MKRYPIDLTEPGDTEVFAAVPDRSLYMHALVLSSDVDVTFKDGTNFSYGPFKGTLILPYSEVPWIECGTGCPLIMSLGEAGNVHGWVIGTSDIHKPTDQWP